MKTLYFISSLAAAAGAVSLFGNAQAQELGAINVLNVATDNPGGYIQTLKDSPEIFEALEADVAGVCLTVVGNQYPGEMFVWTVYPTLAGSLEAGAKFAAAPTGGAVAELRRLIDSEVYIPQRAFDLNPGVERVFKVRTDQTAAYVEALHQAEAAIQANGFEDVFLVAFTAPMSGPEEIGVVTVRIIAPDAERLGALTAVMEVERPDWYMQALVGVAATGREIINDSVEACQVIYTPE